MPGDRIKIVEKRLVRNGKPVDEPYAAHKTDHIDPYRDNFPSEPSSMVYPGAMDMLQNHLVNNEVVVPVGSYFVLGDNRDNSLDSRYWGFVSNDDIVGRPILVYYSTDVLSDESTSQNTLRFDWSRVRWDCFFKIPR